MSLAICPGSFDPVTLGHIDVIRRASVLFDKVIVLAMYNSTKHYAFTLEERADFLRRATLNFENVEVDTYEGLLADYTQEVGATAVVKGLRVMSDFEYEFQMALTNMTLNPNTETVFLPTSIDCMFLSSSMVREVAQHGRDIFAFVPREIAGDIQKKLYCIGMKQDECDIH